MIVGQATDAGATDASWWHDALTTGLPAIVAIAVVVIGGVIQWKLAERQISATESRWSDEQRFERSKLIRQDRVGTYVELLALMSRLQRVMERTHPTITPAPEPPPWPDEEELELLFARLDAFGSDPARTATLRAFDVMREFQATSMLMTHLQASERTQYGDRSIEMWTQLANHRQQMTDAVEAIRVVVSGELHDPSES